MFRMLFSLAVITVGPVDPDFPTRFRAYSRVHPTMGVLLVQVVKPRLEQAQPNLGTSLALVGLDLSHEVRSELSPLA